MQFSLTDVMLNLKTVGWKSCLPHTAVLVWTFLALYNTVKEVQLQKMMLEPEGDLQHHSLKRRAIDRAAMFDPLRVRTGFEVRACFHCGVYHNPLFVSDKLVSFAF